ncbi:28605_t:CDS:2 [Dentiscutata erythropus]|uniref:28605_t:CDS:1 n=1 Tax=Dentiscutata erythropus TaxID=1348616 RepID=A0A9N8VZS2_9GLOM|nr:28605_t:CDS:2 [Dentiscutata erythropus]
MRGVYNINPLNSHDDNVVDLTPTFDKIHSYSDNETMNISLLLHKMIDEDVIFSIKNPKEHKISLAHGGNKPQTKKQKSCLLLVSTSSHKPLTSSMIANWIKKVLIKASPNLRAKNTKTLVAFYTQFFGANLSTILAIDNWFSHSTYQQFYQRGVMSMIQKTQVAQGILSKQNDPNTTVTQIDYSLTTPTSTALTTQLQQSGQNTITSKNNKPVRAPRPVPVSMRKTTEILTLIITTNTDPNLVQQLTSAVDLQFSNFLGLSRSKDILTTEFNLLTADNLALLPDSTTNSHQNLSIDTHSNTTIESLSKKSYTTALTNNQKLNSKYKCILVFKDLAAQYTDKFDKLKWHNDYIILHHPLLPTTLNKIKAIINYISTTKPIILLATSQQQVEPAIAFLHTHFTFREVLTHIIDISKLPVSK